MYIFVTHGQKLVILGHSDLDILEFKRTFMPYLKKYPEDVSDISGS